MTAAASRRFLHVANGTCTTDTIEAAGRTRSIWADPLHDGPVPGGLSDSELLEVRRQFLASPGDLSWTAWAGNDPPLDPANDLLAWDPMQGQILRGTIARTAAGSSVLARQLDRVTTCGIDRWFGGVHLHGRNPPWRWDGTLNGVVRVGA
ncbi:MAG TPA: hypothetical protein VD833_17260 [Vicinamibacterales bacterium]|nr:hypothetical protein [Vicinamibacterales bacterium]